MRPPVQKIQETQVLDPWVGKIPWRRKWQLATLLKKKLGLWLPEVECERKRSSGKVVRRYKLPVINKR